MRVLQVCECFAGGNFSSVTQICSGLARRGHEVHLGFSRRPDTPPEFASILHPAIRLHELRMTRKIAPVTDLHSLLSILSLLRRVDPDVIHLHSSKAGFIGRAAGFLAGRTDSVFYSPRGLPFLQQDCSKALRRMFRRLEWAAARLGGTVVACSQGELDQVRTYVAPRATLLIENAVDVSMIVPQRQRADGKVRIGTVGRITAARSPRRFAALAQRLQCKGVEIVWIGGGDEADREWLTRCGVQVTGWLPRHKALEHLADLDIYLQTSLWEGMPVAVIEAQVAGIPAVVTDVLGNRDVVSHGETGFVGRNEDEMLAHLARLIAEPETRRAFGQRSRERGLIRFSVERLLDELLAAYATAAARPAGG